ncbi:hypothetical protein [Gaoshiqia sp. Z1-71]|uniref:hypothetical protein n=1 Tax=Gaoshiqia hydrogeniformans TaxID=3290090 RepID=UPI003BF885B6
MFKESLKTKSTGGINRSFMASFRTFNLLPLIEKMKHKPTLFKRDLHSMILLNDPDKQIVLTTFDRGTEINSFQSDEQMILQVIWGKLRFHAHEESLDLSQGEFLIIQVNKPYILTTGEKTMFLLTLIPGNPRRTTSKFTK